jgi:hypothetical protein
LAPGVAAVVLTVVVPLAPLPQTAATPVAAQPAAAASARTGVVATAAAERRKRFTPKPGVIVSNPLNSNRKRVMNHILKSIKATRRGQTIRIISWNVASRDFVRVLSNAHDRGVSVRLLMSKQKAEAQPRDGDFWRLRRALRKPNGQPDRMRSWARGCDRSCRGRRGIAHSKLFLFSKVGRAENVVMSTSANATDVSIYRQWNDLYTHRGSREIFRGFMDVFAEAARDKPVRRGFRTFEGRDVTGYAYPWTGSSARGDRVKNELKRITCRGARGGTGVNGRTQIRISQDAIIDKRGIEIAHILRNKHEAGCNIKIVYALMGREVRRILLHTNRGPIRIRQIVQDWDLDGVYDRYLHAKAMSVSGWYRKDRSARIAWQGSENWSGLAKLSDEQGFQIRRAGAEGVYTRWVDWLYDNPPPQREPTTTTLATARARGVDPYALIKEELGLVEAASQG